MKEDFSCGTSVTYKIVYLIISMLVAAGGSYIAYILVNKVGIQTYLFEKIKKKVRREAAARKKTEIIEDLNKPGSIRSTSMVSYSFNNSHLKRSVSISQSGRMSKTSRFGGLKRFNTSNLRPGSNLRASQQQKSMNSSKISLRTPKAKNSAEIPKNRSALKKASTLSGSARKRNESLFGHGILGSGKKASLLAMTNSNNKNSNNRHSIIGGRGGLFGAARKNKSLFGNAGGGNKMARGLLNLAKLHTVEEKGESSKSIMKEKRLVNNGNQKERNVNTRGFLGMLDDQIASGDAVADGRGRLNTSDRRSQVGEKSPKNEENQEEKEPNHPRIDGGEEGGAIGIFGKIFGGGPGTFAQIFSPSKIKKEEESGKAAEKKSFNFKDSPQNQLKKEEGEGAEKRVQLKLPLPKTDGDGESEQNSVKPTQEEGGPVNIIKSIFQKIVPGEKLGGGNTDTDKNGQDKGDGKFKSATAGTLNNLAAPDHSGRKFGPRSDKSIDGVKSPRLSVMSKKSKRSKMSKRSKRSKHSKKEKKEKKKSKKHKKGSKSPRTPQSLPKTPSKTPTRPSKFGSRTSQPRKSTKLDIGKISQNLKNMTPEHKRGPLSNVRGRPSLSPLSLFKKESIEVPDIESDFSDKEGSKDAKSAKSGIPSHNQPTPGEFDSPRKYYTGKSQAKKSKKKDHRMSKFDTLSARGSVASSNSSRKSSGSRRSSGSMSRRNKEKNKNFVKKKSIFSEKVAKDRKEGKRKKDEKKGGKDDNKRSYKRKHKTLKSERKGDLTPKSSSKTPKNRLKSMKTAKEKQPVKTGEGSVKSGSRRGEKDKLDGSRSKDGSASKTPKSKNSRKSTFSKRKPLSKPQRASIAVTRLRAFSKNGDNDSEKSSGNQKPKKKYSMFQKAVTGLERKKSDISPLAKATDSPRKRSGKEKKPEKSRTDKKGKDAKKEPKDAKSKHKKHKKEKKDKDKKEIKESPQKQRLMEGSARPRSGSMRLPKKSKEKGFASPSKSDRKSVSSNNKKKRPESRRSMFSGKKPLMINPKPRLSMFTGKPK